MYCVPGTCHNRPMGAPFLPFHYMQFAKEELHGATHQLGLSGIDQLTTEAFLDMFGDPCLLVSDGERSAALAEWRSLVAERYAVPEGHVLPALGTSGAVFLALAALTSLDERDRPVAIESPAYPAFEVAARLLGRAVTSVSRSAADRYSLDPERVANAFREGAGIVCVTDLHNPSGVALDAAAVDALRASAREFDGWVVLDEVYRDFRGGPVGTGYRDGERVVTMSSLTKVYGMGGPRLGWLFAPPEVRDRAERISEITHGMDPAPSIGLAMASLRRADDLLRRTRRIIRRARPVIDAWLDATETASWVPPGGGISGLVRLEGLTDSHTFARRLRAELDVQVIPGAFFGAEGHVRVSFGLPPSQLQQALEVFALGIGPLVRTAR